MAKKEYIERGAAIEFIEQYTPHLEGETTLRCVKTAFENVPAADVVPVVRCKDCIFFTPSATRYWCRRHLNIIEISPNQFCSYGERKEQE